MGERVRGGEAACVCEPAKVSKRGDRPEGRKATSRAAHASGATPAQSTTTANIHAK